MPDRAAPLIARYDMRVRVAFVVGLIACSAPGKQTTEPSPAAEPQRDLAIAEPPPKQQPPPPDDVDPRDPRWIVRGTARREEVIFRRHVAPEPRDVLVAESDLWSPCVKDYVQAQRAHVRRALTAAFARYAATCDAAGRIVVGPPHEMRGKPFVAYAGKLAPGRHDLVVQFGACAAPAKGNVDQIVVVYDGKRWSVRDPSTDRFGSCTIASVDDQRAVRRLLRDVIDARDAAIVFEGAGIEDVTITDEMKRDLRLMLDALDALAT